MKMRRKEEENEERRRRKKEREGEVEEMVGSAGGQSASERRAGVGMQEEETKGIDNTEMREKGNMSRSLICAQCRASVCSRRG